MSFCPLKPRGVPGTLCPYVLLSKKTRSVPGTYETYVLLSPKTPRCTRKLCSYVLLSKKNALYQEHYALMSKQPVPVIAILLSLVIHGQFVVICGDNLFLCLKNEGRPQERPPLVIEKNYEIYYFIILLVTTLPSL